MDTMKTIIAAILTSLPFSSQAQSLGLTCWTIEGGQTKLAVENSFMEVPDSIAAIDLCGIEDIALDCSSANPNCLYYIDKATSVEGLPSANVVHGRVELAHGFPVTLLAPLNQIYHT